MVIGITGGVGTGKSAVMNIMKNKYHAKVLLADNLGHEVMQKGQPAYDAILERFGTEILAYDGSIDRARLAEIVFCDEEKRTVLNEIVHPQVLGIIRKQLQEWKGEALAAVESAIMFEAGCDALCDEVWGVVAEREVRVKRLMSRRGYSMEKIERMMASQLPETVLRDKCQQLIWNNGSFDDLDKTLALRMEGFLNHNKKFRNS
jgi:dephospho-CoA kinase